MKYRKNDKIRKTLFGGHHGDNWSRQSPYMDLKLAGQNLWGKA